MSPCPAPGLPPALPLPSPTCQVSPADYIKPSFVPNFRAAWDALPEDSEMVDDYGIGQRDSLQVGGRADQGQVVAGARRRELGHCARQTHCRDGLRCGICMCPAHAEALHNTTG